VFVVTGANGGGVIRKLDGIGVAMLCGPAGIASEPDERHAEVVARCARDLVEPRHVFVRRRDAFRRDFREAELDHRFETRRNL
jgi:hypothetical protein